MIGLRSIAMKTRILGEPRFDSKRRHTVRDDVRIPERIEIGADPGLQFELAGPRAKLYFDAKKTRAGIVTCGGLCPGLNNVIRSLFLELHHGYGVRNVLGFRGGYSGLDPKCAVDAIHFQSLACQRRSTTMSPSSRVRSDFSAQLKKPRACSIARIPKPAACLAESGL